MKRFLSVLLCLALLLSVCAYAEDAPEILVLKKFKKLKDASRQIAASSAAVVDITKTPVTIKNLHTLMEEFPDRTFRYVLNAFNHRTSWDAEEVNFGTKKIESYEEICAFIDLLPNLRVLTVWGHTFTAEQLDSLYASHPKLEKINCRVYVANYQLRTDITAFCTKHALYTKERHTEADFSAMRYCTELIALDIGHNSCADLSFLDLLPNKLQILIVADNRITDLEPLSRQTELEYLELMLNDGITDISPLASCTKLIDLHIGHCSISDITPLYSLEHLDRLWLAKNPIPQEQIDTIRELMPDCTVNDTATGHPTAEGWRQGHPRYLKIAEMFKNNKYVPFP